MNCVLFAKVDQVFSKENKTLKKLENWKKILEKSLNFVSPENWEPSISHSLARHVGQKWSQNFPCFLPLEGNAGSTNNGHSF